MLEKVHPRKACSQGDRTPAGLSLSPSRGRYLIYQRLAHLEHTLLSESDMLWLGRQLVVRRYAAGEIILKAGRHGDCLGLVRSGQVAVYSASNPTNPSATLLPGGVFGEAMLTEGCPSKSTLCAVADTEIFFLRRVDFLASIERCQFQRIDRVGRLSYWLTVAALIFLVIGGWLTLDPSWRSAALLPYSAGLWLERQGHDAWAETVWTLTQHITPGWAAPHLSLGRIYFRQGRLDQAKSEFEQALALAPDWAEGLNNLGVLYAAQGDHTNAAQTFQQALALEPGQAAVESNLALSLQWLGRQDEALQHYALAHALDTPRSVVLLNEAVAYYETGDLPAAESATRQALEQGGLPVPAYTVLGAVNLARQCPEAAIASLEEAVRLDSAYGPAYFYLGLAYKSLNQPERAGAAFEHVLDLNPDSLTQREASLHLSELYSLYGIHNDGDRFHMLGGGLGNASPYP